MRQKNRQGIPEKERHGERQKEATGDQDRGGHGQRDRGRGRRKKNREISRKPDTPQSLTPTPTPTSGLEGWCWVDQTSPNGGAVTGAGDQESGHFWALVPPARRPRWGHPRRQRAGPGGRPLPEVHAWGEGARAGLLRGRDTQSYWMAPFTTTPSQNIFFFGALT